MLGGHRFNDDVAGGHGYVDMYRSIVISCDTYYYQLGNEMGIDRHQRLHEAVRLRLATGIDLEHEKTGVLPSQEWKRARFKNNRAAQKWVGGDTISISIGNGFNNYTMLQLAHAVATLANDGVRHEAAPGQDARGWRPPRAHAHGARNPGASR
jgi:penicillin-binding protein 2